LEAQKVEGDEQGREPSTLGQQRNEVAPTVVAEDDRLAVDPRPLS
jgi:hypothetical protein